MLLSIWQNFMQAMPKLYYQEMSIILLSAVEVCLHEFLDGLRVVLDVATQSAVIERTELLDDTINHSLAEHTFFLVHGTLTLKTLGRSPATVRQLCQLFQFTGICRVVYIQINVCVVCHLESIVQLETMTTCHAQTCDKLIQVGTSVRRAHLYGLL